MKTARRIALPFVGTALGAMAGEVKKWRGKEALGETECKTRFY
jgi:hypothetical protein